MNRKVLFAFVALFAVAMLATPIIGSAVAGNGEEKLDFRLHMVGRTIGPPEKTWTTDGGTTHVQNLPWIIQGDFYIEIGVGGEVETIPKDRLSYEGHLDITINTKQGFYVGNVEETITIYTSSAKTTVRGTLEILNKAHTNLGGDSNSMFDGHGTGAFEGVKLHGTSASAQIANPAPPPANLLVLDRIGTVMGWP